MHYESEAILAGMLYSFERSDFVYLLIAGNLTCGKRNSRLAFVQLPAQTEQRDGIK